MSRVKNRAGIRMHIEAERGLSTWQTAKPTEINKRFIIQEREVSYRFTLHQHPYVGRLTQRLLSGGVAGLQAADTEYVGNEARPDSVLFEMGASDVTVAPGARLALREPTTATLEGAPSTLAAGTAFTFRAATTVTPHATPPDVPRLRATLLGPLANVPTPGSLLPLRADSSAVVQGNTLVTLRGSADVVLTGGKKVTLPQHTPLALADGARIVLPAETEVTAVRAKRRPVLFAPALADYAPATLVELPYPAKDLDFSSGGAYSVYNWELFYHVPMTVAMHLSRNGRYGEAQRWFHLLFDPTDSSDEPTPDRFWKVQPFHTTAVRKIEETLVNLATGLDPELREQTIHSINAWKAAPFRPHVIARYRQQAYMYKTVMAYLDNLIAWGDSLFRQDTGEAIDEAMMLYVLAANILGPRPQAAPTKGLIRPQTYHNLRQDLEHFGSVVRELEADAPFDLAPLPPPDNDDGSGLATVRSLGRALYFCVPRNDKLLGYWDTVADRLFKIRNSLNMQGTFRQLALFEPPIDPALLARATAAGLDVGAVLSGLSQPVALVRFQLLAQKAAEIAQEVKSLGHNLLSTMEKEDGETLAILRARHERILLEMVEHVRYAQHQEAVKAREGLLSSLASAVQRFAFYEMQLGSSLDDALKAIPELPDLDQSALEKMRLRADEPEVRRTAIQVDIAQDLGESGGKIISSFESSEFKSLERAMKLREEASGMDLIAKFLTLIPEFGAQAQPWGLGAAIQFGGRALSTQLSLAADSSKTLAERATHEAGRSSRVGSYSRRELDWVFQRNLAAGEINQIYKQLRAAQLREAAAELELKNHRRQIANAQEIEFFLTGEKGSDWTKRIDPKENKATSKALYTWLKREVKGLHNQAFQFAFDVAKKAERALQHELGDPSLAYIQPGHLAGKEGLLAGEKLYLDIKRMEMAYLELNRREYELIKHVSLLQVDPLALIRLRATGRCTFRLPESLFDMDGPGHYFRRIKNLAVSVPSVTGPYVSVNCTLTLLKSTIRITPAAGDGYAEADLEDTRFSHYLGSVQSIVTSSAQNDSGLFDTNLRDERYLPFENAGAISEWQLELPGNPSQNDPLQFDYETISDVILHCRYTAREGGTPLRQGALNNLKALIDGANAAGTTRLFSMRHEFPNEWAKFQAQPPADDQRFVLDIGLRPEHYPFWSKGRLTSVTRVDAIARSSKPSAPTTIDVFDTADKTDATAESDTLTRDATLGNLLIGRLSDKTMPAAPVADLKLYFDDKDLGDLWLAVTWSGTRT
jgi:hypothetical protein